MKKVICFLSALTLLSVSLTVAVTCSLVKESDNVTFTLIDEWGDKTYLEGITAEMNFTCNGRLDWDVKFSPAGKTETEYQYNTIVPKHTETYRNYGLYNTSYSLLDMKNDNEKLKADLDNLKNEMKNPGDIRYFNIKLKDYYEYYPVNFEFTLGEMHISWSTSIGYDDAGSYEFSGISYTKGTDFINTLNDYIRIPVHEEDTRKIRLHKSDDGFSYSGSHSGSFDFEFHNAVFADTLYFTFSNEIKNSEKSERVLTDTSLIPGGYGIYAIDYTETEVNYKEIKTVYSIPSDATVKALFCNEEKNELYLTLHQNDKYILRVIDTASMTDIAVIELFDFHFEEYVTISQQEDFFVFIKNSTDYNVVRQNTDGIFVSALKGTIPSETENIRNYFSPYSQFCFDGEKLAILVIENPGYEQLSIMSIQPDIMILNEDGLLYYGKWICSLSRPVSNRQPINDIRKENYTITIN